MPTRHSSSPAALYVTSSLPQADAGGGGVMSFLPFVPSFLLLHRTQISDGEALMVVCAVGVHSQWGTMLTDLDPESDDTPLQEALESLATSTTRYTSPTMTDRQEDV